MEYQVQFGRLDAKPAQKGDGKKFRIAILGDFSARGNSGAISTGSDLANRKFLKANHENLDSLLERLQVKLMLPAGVSGSMIPIPINSMEDFHPDQLFSNVPLFEKLQSLRQKLQDPASFEKAAAAVRSLAADPSLGTAKPLTRSQSNQVPRAKIDSFADLLNAEPRSIPAEPAELKTLLRDVVGAHVVPSMTGQTELIEAVDKSLSALMTTLLHHPDFQSLESLWRSLELLLHRVELDEGVEVVLFDIHAAEFAADLAAHENLEDAGVYKWLVENPSLDANQGPFSLIIGNFQWELIPPHAELLARAAQIAAAAGAPLVSSIDKNALAKVEPDDVHPLITQTWDALRALPQSCYLALVSPRHMLRYPYGKKSDPIESFKLEEFTPQSGLKGMLWGNGAFLVGVSLAQNFVMNGLKEMKLGALLSIDEIPFYYYNDAYGDQTALPCTERLINVATAQYATSKGFIPLLSLAGRAEVRLGGLNAINGTPLAGPWAPVTFDGSGQAAPAVSSSTEEWKPKEEPQNAAPGATPPAAADGGDELDLLLASLESSDSPAPGTSDSSEMDPDLAALLADL